MHQQYIIDLQLKNKREGSGEEAEQKMSGMGEWGGDINYFSPPVTITPSLLIAIALTMVFCWELGKICRHYFRFKFTMKMV